MVVSIPTGYVFADSVNLIAGKLGAATDGNDTTYISTSEKIVYLSPATKVLSFRAVASRTVEIYLYASDGYYIGMYTNSGAGSTTNIPDTGRSTSKIAIRSSGDQTYNLYEAQLFGEQDLIPPPDPTGLSGTAGDTKVTLSWNGVSDPALNGYKVYKNGVLYATVPGTTATVTGLVNGTSYAFSVSAIDKSGNESGKTSPINLTPVGPPPPDTTAPAVPTGLTGKAGNKQAILSWSANKESDLAGYVIYQDGQKLKTVTGTTDSIGNLTNGKTYSYRISAIDNSGNESAKSNEVKITPSEMIEVVTISNVDSIILQIRGGSTPYTVDWGSDSAEVNETQFTIPGLTAKTSYTITITDAGGLTWTGTVNTGDQKAYVPPSMPSPESMFQGMLDVFGTAGSIAVAIIGGAILLGIICVLAMWAWRLLKRWMLRTK